ncbi:BQ5605_C011g06335 [Microbotryum silenes-dioicae]|uniref:BQ5605_C011g06335 protein n=1 Tax=Microbotryum silenes-dioicae TaxID=796604 RepID=A0A2X0M9G2_9BASI|nr:BQ5605_C011g06335 [Microbotryum silenes-dioicae]
MTEALQAAGKDTANDRRDRCSARESLEKVMPPIAEFSGESQSPGVATYTSCFRVGEGGGYASVFR